MIASRLSGLPMLSSLLNSEKSNGTHIIHQHEPRRTQGVSRRDFQGALSSLAADPDNEPMVNVKEAARITGLAINTIYDKTHRRGIPFYKKGKRIYFRESELLAWIENGRVMTQDEIDAKAISYTNGHPAGGKGKYGRKR